MVDLLALAHDHCCEARLAAQIDAGLAGGGLPRGHAGVSKRARAMNDRLSAEEKRILERFENDELPRAPGAKREMEAAREAARNTFKKTRRVNLRVTERDFDRAHARAREEGIPYQTLLSSVIHKYLSGRLVERR